MFKNYFKIAFRNLWKHKIFSLINIGGLSVGVAFTMLIGAYVWGELQVNRDLKNADQQYMILSKWRNPNMGLEFNSIDQLSRALKANYPELVANYYNSFAVYTNVSNKNDSHFREGILLGDSTLLNMYGFKLLHGDAASAMRDPFTVVLTGEAAKKYFGKTDVVGQSLAVEDFSGHKQNFMITGVLDKLPGNTITNAAYHDINFFISNVSSKYFNRRVEFTGWGNGQSVDHIELKKGADPAAVERAMADLLKKNVTDDIVKDLTPYLMPLKSYYLKANNGVVEKMIWALSSIAFFILLMAIINFVNICIGRSSGRMKEIGVRKVMGGMRRQLIGQFLTESVLTVSFATILGIGIYLFASPYFGKLLGKDIPELSAFPVYFMLIPLLFVLIIGVIAGLYPAMVLSALKTIDSIKGKLNSVKENMLFQKVLVAFQFTTAAVVFTGAIIISQQISLFFNSNLGYKKDYVVYAPVPRDWSPKGEKKMEAIRYQFAQMPVAGNVSLSWELPANIDLNNGNAVYREGGNPQQAINAQHLSDDNEFAATYGIPVTAGTFFKPIVTEDDSSQAVINETALKALGFKNPDDAIGQTIMFVGDAFKITGVTADFHFGSMQERIQPAVFTNVNYSNHYRYLSFKLQGGDMSKNIAALQTKWNQLMPGEPFAWSFMDDALKKVYSSELQLKKAAYIAAGLAIVIVLLGVLGLVSLSIQKRTKEIGIRKVLGSPVAGIIVLFLKDFLGVILIACVVACPLAYLLMNNWLNDYAYRISISAFPFVVSLMVLVAITTVLIIAQTIKAAVANPIKSLKNE